MFINKKCIFMVVPNFFLKSEPVDRFLVVFFSFLEEGRLPAPFFHKNLANHIFYTKKRSSISYQFSLYNSHNYCFLRED